MKKVNGNETQVMRSICHKFNIMSTQSLTRFNKVLQFVSMLFLFIDETGDPGAKGSPHFGYGLLHVQHSNYRAIRHLLSQIRWLRGIFGDLSKLSSKSDKNTINNILQALSTLSEAGHIMASGLYIDKSTYGGRFLNWSELEIPQKEWPYYLRNYLLRHLLEYHFSLPNVDNDEIDLVTDRILLTDNQRRNTVNYLNSKTEIQLEKPFPIPPVKHLTIADSEYICGLEIAHVLADVVNKIAEGASPEYLNMVKFMSVQKFDGHTEKDLKTKRP
ncbi:MAG: DUF3800 domain-containing protein [Dehalococcoidia bacterium]